MSIEANKALIRRYWLELWNEKQGDLIDRSVRRTCDCTLRLARLISLRR